MAESLDPEAFNDFSTPLVDKDQKDGAKLYGYSFNSKRMAQGPHFFNLRIMCHCLGAAVKRHIDFSRGTFQFLDDLNDAKANEKADYAKALTKSGYAGAIKKADYANAIMKPDYAGANQDWPAG